MRPMGSLTVRFLGTGDPASSGGRMQSCLLLEHAGGRTLLDCGATSVAAMGQRGVDPLAVDTLLVSHLHGDHLGGVPFLLMARWLSVRRDEVVRPLTIAGPPGVEAQVARLLEACLYMPLPGIADGAPLAFLELEPRRATRVGPLEVPTFPVIHVPNTNPHALRVVWDGRVVAYSGDTVWLEELVEVADGADLFVCDSWAYEGREGVHPSYRVLLAERPRLRCPRLALTHLGPSVLARLPEIRAELAADPTTFVAEDGLTLEL